MEKQALGQERMVQMVELVEGFISDQELSQDEHEGWVEFHRELKQLMKEEGYDVHG